MTAPGWTVVGVAAVLALATAWYLVFLARRLDRLHRRIVTARTTLEAQLDRRASSAIELAGCGALEPASAMLLAGTAARALDSAEARVEGSAEGRVEGRAGGMSADRSGAPGKDVATRALAAAEANVEDAQTDLSRALRATLKGLTPADLYVADQLAWPVPALATACQRVELARRFHNEAVLAVQAVRSKRWVRWTRLAGGAPMPITLEFDDEVPTVLTDPELADSLAD